MTWLRAFLHSRAFKPLVFAACLAPGAHLGWRVWTADLGVNPVETLLHETGRNALGLLLITLAVTPLRRLTGLARLQAVRRMLGVFAFTYALAHFLIYFVFDQTLTVAFVWEDVSKRPFIFAGMLAFVILLLLAATSTNGWMRRLRRHWQRLHRLVYLAAAAGVVHFIWKQKADVSEPLRWAAVLGVLLGFRAVVAVRRRFRRRSG